LGTPAISNIDARHPKRVLDIRTTWPYLLFVQRSIENALSGKIQATNVFLPTGNVTTLIVGGFSLPHNGGSNEQATTD
jgi:hypothetical protein